MASRVTSTSFLPPLPSSSPLLTASDLPAATSGHANSLSPGEESRPRTASSLLVQDARRFSGAGPYLSSVSPSTRTSKTRVDVVAMEHPELEDPSSGTGIVRGGDQSTYTRDEGEEEGEGELSLSIPVLEVRPPASSEDAAAEVVTKEEPVPQTPQVSLCFLTISGRRRTQSFDPETTVGRVKELVWNAWPSEWQDERPPAPSYLRILYLGKILQDEDTLTKVGFPIYTPNTTSSNAPTSSPTSPQSPTSLPAAPTIVHLSVRPFGPGAPDENTDALKKKRGGRRGRRGTSTSGDAQSDALGGAGGGADGEGADAGRCCGCVVM